MVGDPNCGEHASQHRTPRQLGVGDYVGRIARSVALANCHLSTVVHPNARKVPGHAHDWPFFSTLLRGSYVSRTRTREMEFRHGVCVYHPRDFQHHDEIGREGGLFFGIQLGPSLLQDADRSISEAGSDIAVLNGDEPYAVLGSLYAALCAGAEPLSLEALVAELAGCLLAPRLSGNGTMPVWL